MCRVACYALFRYKPELWCEECSRDYLDWITDQGYMHILSRKHQEVLQAIPATDEEWFQHICETEQSRQIEQLSTTA